MISRKSFIVNSRCIPQSIAFECSEISVRRRWGCRTSFLSMINDINTNSRIVFRFVVTWVPSLWRVNSNELHNISTRCWVFKIPLQFTDTNFTRILKNRHVITWVLVSCRPYNDRTFSSLSTEHIFNTRRSSDQSQTLHKSWLISLFLIIPESMITFPIVFGELPLTRAWYLVAAEYIEWLQVTGTKIFQYYHFIFVITSYFWHYYLYLLVSCKIVFHLKKQSRLFLQRWYGMIKNLLP